MLHVRDRQKIYTKFWSENLKRPAERPRCRWDDNIKMDLK
jgi:hypothetical protein